MSGKSRTFLEGRMENLKGEAALGVSLITCPGQLHLERIKTVDGYGASTITCPCCGKILYIQVLITEVK